MELDKLTGMIPPVVVPFDREGEIDEEAFRSEVRYLLDAGIDGISSGGSTGEGALLSDRELARCLQLIGQENTEGLPVLAGVIRNSSRDVIKAGLEAKDLGADGLLVTPVFYHGATDEGNYEFFREIGETVQLPVIIYNVVPTNLISPELFQKILEIDWVIGIKQVDPVKLAEIAAVNTGSYNVYAACDQMLYGTYVAGACGAISALVTVAPRQCVQQWRAYREGNQQEAMVLQKKLVPIVMTYLQAPFPGKIKMLINLQGRRGGLPRKPTLMPGPELAEKMREALRGAGIRVIG